MVAVLDPHYVALMAVNAISPNDVVSKVVVLQSPSNFADDVVGLGYPPISNLPAGYKRSKADPGHDRNKQNGG